MYFSASFIVHNISKIQIKSYKESFNYPYWAQNGQFMLNKNFFQNNQIYITYLYLLTSFIVQNYK